MANQAIALQARGPQLPDVGALNARYANMMANMANMEKIRTERGITANIRGVMADPSFDPTDAASLNKLVALGPAGVDAASKVMSAQQLRGNLTSSGQERAKERVSQVGSGLIGLLRDSSDENLAQTVETFKSVGMDPAEYEAVIAQLSKMPDLNQRKVFTLQFIGQSDGARNALKFVAPNIKAEQVGDAKVFIDDNANSPTFGSELFRITASPEPVKLNQQVANDTLYNINPVTGVASEATIGDARAGLIPQPRTTTRTDTGVVSPYAIQNAAAPAATEGLPGPRAAVPAPAPMAAARGATPVATALQTNPGAMVDNEYTRSLPGYAGASGGFATFNTPQAGIAAQENMLRRSYVGSGINTVNKIIDKYTPASKENPEANRNSYKNHVARKLGIDLNTPITAAQVPALAAAMREFETGARPGGTPVRAAAPAGTPVAPQKTIEEAATRKAFGKILPIIGYNAEKGTNRVEDLIKASTSGVVEMGGSEILGAFGQGTPGRVALGELSAIAENMTFEKLKGKLGAQISDADVRLIARTMADIANGNEPANVRLAAWQNTVLPILLRGAGVEPKTPTGGGNAPPPAAVEMLLKNPALRGRFDQKYGTGAAAKVLKGR